MTANRSALACVSACCCSRRVVLVLMPSSFVAGIRPVRLSMGPTRAASGDVPLPCLDKGRGASSLVGMRSRHLGLERGEIGLLGFVAAVFGEQAFQRGIEMKVLIRPVSARL